MTAAGRPRGRPGHDACFGACHGPPPRAPVRAIADELARVCTACHAPSALAEVLRGRVRGLAPPWPPYRHDRDWGLAMSHRRHDAAASCDRCHGARAPRAPHARCVGCHRPGASTTPAPSLDACTTCHVAAYGPVTGPHLETGTFAVGAAFSHPRHAARGATCRGCHAAVLGTDDASLPAPSMAGCGTAGCHDGTKAFAVVDACTRCHRGPPSGTFRPARPDVRFSHERHVARLDGEPCSACHGLDRRGDATPPGHRACAPCHAEDFAQLAPTTCGACHIATEPWRPLRPDRLPPDETELGARFSHRSHATASIDCRRCHQLATAVRELRPPRGHASCTGAGCHGRAAAPAPALTACEACHVLRLIDAREQARQRDPWSVRAAFQHAPHARDTAGAAVPCARCHRGVEDATDAIAVPTPPKATCAPCHDGATAFKLTGHGCARCHRTPR
jgi:c(7)-type cytochrome triheme protein